MSIFSKHMNQILPLIIGLHDNIILLSITATTVLLGINNIEQLDNLSLANIINDHLHLVVARLDKQLFQLCQVIFEQVPEKTHSGIILARGQ